MLLSGAFRLVLAAELAPFSTVATRYMSTPMALWPLWLTHL